MQSATANTGALPQPPNAPQQGRVMPQQVFAPPFSMKDYGHVTTDPLRSFGGAFSNNAKYADNRNMGDTYRGYTQQQTNYASHNRGGGGYARNQIYGGMQHRQQIQQPSSQVQGQRLNTDTYSRMEDASTQPAPVAAATNYDDSWARSGQPPQLKEPAPAPRPQRRDHFQRRDDYFAGTGGAAHPQSATQATVSQYETHQPRIQSDASAASAPVLDESSSSHARQSVWTLSADQLGGVKPNRSAAEFTSPADVRMALSVAGEFTFHYFQLMQTQPHMLHHFYCADSQLAHGSTVWQHSKWNRAVGEHDIEQLFANMLHVDKREGSQQGVATQAATGSSTKQSVIIRANVKTLEAQPTRDGGIVMQATGIIETRDLGPRPFAHTIVMHRAPEAGSYVVLHDIFVFLDDLSTTPPLTTAAPFNPNAVWRSTHSDSSSATGATTTVPPAVHQGGVPALASVPMVTPIVPIATPVLVSPGIQQTNEPPSAVMEPLSAVPSMLEIAKRQQPETVVAPGPDPMSATGDSTNLDHPPMDPPGVREPSPAQTPESEEGVNQQRPPSDTMKFDVSFEAESQYVIEEVVEEPGFGATRVYEEMEVVAKGEEAVEEQSGMEVEEDQEEEESPMGEKSATHEEEIHDTKGMDESLAEKKGPTVPAAPWKNVSRIPPAASKLPSESVVVTNAPQIGAGVPVAASSAMAEEVLEAHSIMEDVQQHHVHTTVYAPNSYAAKLLQGVSALPKQRGTVVKRARESAPTTPSTREQSSGNQLSEAYHSKAVWVAQVDQVTNTQIEQAVAQRLKGCPVEGRVVRIERMRNGPAGVIELDSEECVPMLLEKGLCLNGREVRIDLYKQGSPPGARSDSPRQNGPRKQQPLAGTARALRQPQNAGRGDMPVRQNPGRGRGAGNRSGPPHHPTHAVGGTTSDEWHAVEGKRTNRKPAAGAGEPPRAVPSGASSNTLVTASHK